MLLLDEPFSNVDVRSAREMVGLLADMRDAGKTIFVVTHQAALLEGAPMSSYGWKLGKSSAALRDLRATRRRDEHRR